VNATPLNHFVVARSASFKTEIFCEGDIRELVRMLRALQLSQTIRAVTCLWQGILRKSRTTMKIKSDYGPDIRLCLDVSPTRIQYSTI